VVFGVCLVAFAAFVRGAVRLSNWIPIKAVKNTGSDNMESHGTPIKKETMTIPIIR
jgi:hypothetical protein